MWYALGSAAALVAAIVHLKWLLRVSKLELRTFLPVQFLFLFILTSLLIPFFGRIDPQAGELRYVLLFVVLIAVAVVWNVFWTRAFRQQSLHEYELIDLLLPVFTIVLAALTFPDEREPVRMLLALFAAGVFMVTHLRRNHLNFKQTDRWFLFAIFLMAAEIILTKPLLLLFSPVSFYCLRTGVIALVMIAIFRPRLRRISSFVWSQMLLNSLLFVIHRLLMLLSIEKSGIVTTELLLLVGPILLAISAYVFFRERWTLRTGLAFGVILLTITVMNYLAL